ncbi:uncharacterized protein LOC142973553 [Anticarsia gemmatalis]|uniref:uncharacterized protein LOC142973553 n=1 Tax=Anticarsia gemmatalis TaxID=129554 RepID=UPI003F76D113
MEVIGSLWRKLTPSKALDKSTPLERRFFETVYRLSFLIGLSNWDDNIPYTLYTIVLRILAVLVVLMEIWHAASDKLSLDEMISAVNVIIIHTLTCWKIITMVRNREMYKKLSKALESPYFDISTKGRRELAEHWANTHKKFMTLLLVIANATLAFWYTFPLIDDVEYNLMTEVHVPVKYDSPFRYVIAYIVVGLMFLSASHMVVVTEVIMQAYLLPLICQYAVLANCFENVFDDCAEDFGGVKRDELINNRRFIDKCTERLGNLVDQHLMILKQTMDLRSILSAPMLGQLCGSGMLICFVGYQATATVSENPGKFMMSVGYLGYNMFTLYLICRWCEEITSQSQKIGQAAYCSGWEGGLSMVPGVKATIMIVIVRSNKPLVFRAGGMYDLSLSSYTNLVKASYSALNILLRMSND